MCGPKSRTAYLVISGCHSAVRNEYVGLTLYFCSFSMSTSECYSESEHDDPEITDTPPPPYTVQTPPPPSVSVPVITLFLVASRLKQTPLRWWASRNNLKPYLEMFSLCSWEHPCPDCPALWQSTQLSHPAP